MEARCQGQSGNNTSSTFTTLKFCQKKCCHSNVKDITEKDVELFFNRFYTADQTRSGKGTGLGLSIAKALMDKMNGKLSAELKDSWLYVKCSWILTE